LIRFVVATLIAIACVPAWALEDAKLWDQLRRGGNVILVRHGSTTTGPGDPPGFRLEDCSTQRNLSDAGRDEARRIGERLKRERVPIGKVYTSPWCRCRETAMLAFGKSEDWTPLSSVFDAPDRDVEYTERVKKRIGTYSSREMKGNVVMVTHNVNIASLTKLSVAPGEMVVVRPDGCCGLRVVGRLLLVGGT
jgi:broad specificity phosphatase PhoE